MFGLVLTIFIAIIEVILGFFVITKKSSSVMHRVFLAFSIFIGLWSVCLGFIFSPLDLSEKITQILINTIMLSGYLVISTFLIFSWVFPQQTIRVSATKLIILFVPFAVIAYLLNFTDLFIKHVNVGKANNRIQFDIRGYSIFAFFFLINSVLATWILVRKYIKSTGIHKQQLTYFGLGSGLSLLLVVIFDVILPVFTNNNYVWLSPFFMVIFLVAVAYAILRYRLLDLEIIIKRTTIYLVIIGIIIGVYTFVLLLPQQLIGTPGSFNSIFILVIAAITIAITMQPLRDWLDSVTDRLFFQRKYDYYHVLEKSAKEINAVFKLEEIINIVSNALIEEMHLTKVAVFLREKAGSNIFVCYKADGEIEPGFPSQVEEGNPLIGHLINDPILIEVGEFTYKYEHLFPSDALKKAIQNELKQTFNAALIVPLIQKKNIAGFMILGGKKSGDLFTSRDLTLLETLSSQMTTALENIRLYEQMITNERLTVIGTLAAGIAHEIRNPLASIKTFIQMLPDKYSNDDFKKRFHDIVGSEIERLSNITADLLTFARPSAPKLDNVSIDQLMDKIKNLLNSPLRKKQIDFTWEVSDLPSIQADPQQLFQVFLNVTLNAIYASKEKGQVKVYGQIKDQMPGRPSGQGLYMLVTIEDFGTGIKRKDLPNLFQPFFTTKTDGTGLGLATCKRILEAHRGDMYIDSEEGKGTKVTVLLPTNLTQETVIVPTPAPIQQFT
ncbi:MAG: ATP-binding protein [candidate division FCPU426 bacterium]